MRAPLAIALLLVALVSGACATADSSAGDGGDTSITTTIDANTSIGGTTTSATAAPPNGEVVPVQAVLDGDSLAVERDGRRTEVRLAGINTPEADECYGDEARTLMQELVGAEVILVPVPDEDDQDQFGRLLRNVWVGGLWLNLRMVEEGAALALQSGSPGEAQLVAAEDQAWQDGTGLWSSTVCGSFPPGLRINDIRYDPPGRDFENKAEEFVLIGNEGDMAVDATGWIVRDESSTHRFRLPAGTVLGPGDGLRIRTGCGQDTGRDLYWCADDAVWSNGGDTVILQTAEGTVVDRWKYAGDF